MVRSLARRSVPRIVPLHLAECHTHVVIGDDPIPLNDAESLCVCLDSRQPKAPTLSAD